MTTKFGRRSVLKMGGGLLAASALLPRAALAQAKTINYWHTFTSQSEQAGLDAVLALFKAAHPDITVTPENIPNPEFMAKITAAVVSGSRPSRRTSGRHPARPICEVFCRARCRALPGHPRHAA